MKYWNDLLPITCLECTDLAILSTTKNILLDLSIKTGVKIQSSLHQDMVVGAMNASRNHNYD